MADNFNFKQFLTENKLGPYSKIVEEVDDKGRKWFDNKEEWESELLAKLLKKYSQEQVEKFKTSYNDGSIFYMHNTSYVDYGQWNGTTKKGYIVMSYKDPSDSVYPKGSTKD